MKYQELMDTIGSSTKDDWVEDDFQENWTYKGDLNIRFEDSTDRVAGSDREFDEPWARKLEHSGSSSRRTFTIYYNNSFVETVYTVAVDGNRSYIPFPRSQEDLVISSWQYAFAKIVEPAPGTAWNLESYLERAGISVE